MEPNRDGRCRPGPAASPYAARSSDEPADSVSHIADPYWDLLFFLSPERRAGLVSRLSHGYYEGWRPSRDEVADIVAVELHILTWEQAANRRRARADGQPTASLTPHIRRTHRERLLSPPSPRCASATITDQEH